MITPRSMISTSQFLYNVHRNWWTFMGVYPVPIVPSLLLTASRLLALQILQLGKLAAPFRLQTVRTE